MTSVKIFVIIVGAVFGYLIVSHFISPKAGAPGAAGKDSPRAAPGAASPPPPPPPSDEDVLRNWDAVLLVSRYAPPEAIRQAYRTQMARYHPDKVASLGEEFRVIAERKAKEINAAYDAACREKGI